MSLALLERTVVRTVPSRVQEPEASVTPIAGMEVSKAFFQQGDVLIERVDKFPRGSWVPAWSAPANTRWQPLSSMARRKKGLTLRQSKRSVPSPEKV